MNCAPGREASFVSAWLTDLHFAWAALTDGARKRRVAKGETVFLEGQAADTVYVIEEGRVLLASDSLEGKERHLLIMGPTGLVGDCGLWTSRRYVVSGIGATDTVLCAVPSSALQPALERHPELLRQWQQLSNLRLRIMLQQLSLLGANAALRRVCHHLLGLVHSYGVPHDDGRMISISFTQQEMGNICALSRVSVSNIFTRLERDGVIGRSGRLVVIRDPQRLAQLATT